MSRAAIEGKGKKLKKAIKDKKVTEGTNPTEGPIVEVSMPEPASVVSDCGGWGGVSNAKTNTRGGRRGR